MGRPRITGTPSVPSARRRGEFGGAQRAVVVLVLAGEGIGQARAMGFTRDGLAATAGLFGGGERAVVVGVHRVEGVAQPILVFDERHAAVVVGVHAREVVGAGGDLRLGRGAGD